MIMQLKQKKNREKSTVSVYKESQFNKLYIWLIYGLLTYLQLNLNTLPHLYMSHPEAHAESIWYVNSPNYSAVILN